MVLSVHSSAPLIAVVGATGLQGGSVVNHLIASDKPYRIRGLTRDASKPNPKDLAARGVEIVTCNIQPGNENEVKKAFSGATYIFMVTNFWEHMDRDREIAEGKLMISCALEAAAAEPPPLLLISSLPSVAKATAGRLVKVHHFEAQAAVAAYAKEVGVRHVEVQPGPYMNNFTTFMRPQPVGGDDSTYYVVRNTWSPGAKLPLIDCAHDFGLFVRLAIESGDYNGGEGRVVSAYAEWLSLQAQADILSEVTGRKVVYEQVSREAAREGMEGVGMPAHVVDDMIEMEEFQESTWAEVFVYTDLEKLPGGLKPRSFREYCMSEDWKATGIFSDL